jgi:hypothetical protein
VTRQFADCRELRFEPFTSPIACKAIAQLASRMRDTFWRSSSGLARPVAGRGQQAKVAAAPTKRSGTTDPGGDPMARDGAVNVVEVAIGYGNAPEKFQVEVVRSPAGEASAEVDLNAGVLLAGRAQFEQTLLVSGVAARRVLTSAERTVREAGQALFTALLGTGEVAGGFGGEHPPFHLGKVRCAASQVTRNGGCLLTASEPW